MKYNIYFELSAIFFVVIIYNYLITQYSCETELNRRFRGLVLLVLFDNVLDVLSAITISYGELIPVGINIILNTSYFILAGLLAYKLVGYISAVIAPDNPNKLLQKINFAIIIIYKLSLLGNVFWGYYIWFDEKGNYQHGDLYALLFVTPFYFVLFSGIYLFYYRRRLEMRQVLSAGAYVTLTFIGIFVQTFIFPDVLLTGFAAALALLVILFSLETPDYQKLVNTMKELEKARLEAEEERKSANIANQAKSKFLANMSHEIRTPINTILGMNEMILRESLEEEVWKYASDIKYSADVLLSIINEILDASKIESGKMELMPVEYKLSRLLNDLHNMTGIKAKDKDLELQFIVEPTLPSILFGDDIRIRQILLNLLTNAVKYTNAGTVTLEVSGIIEGAQVILHYEVRDTGIGIKEEDLSKLDMAFERIDEIRNRNIEGTGLGINITVQLLELMGSRLQVQSEYERGSIFSFDLIQKIVSEKPIGDFHEKIQKKNAEYASRSLFTAPNARVLVVDDSQINRLVFCNLLKRNQIQVTDVGSGSECLDIIQKMHFDIIFMDHMMPEMDGIETFEKMRELEGSLCRETKVIMLTANAIKGSKERYMAAGFDDYLTKPIIPEKLERMLQTILSA